MNFIGNYLLNNCNVLNKCVVLYLGITTALKVDNMNSLLDKCFFFLKALY